MLEVQPSFSLSVHWKLRFSCIKSRCLIISQFRHPYMQCLLCFRQMSLITDNQKNSSLLNCFSIISPSVWIHLLFRYNIRYLPLLYLMSNLFKWSKIEAMYDSFANQNLSWRLHAMRFPSTTENTQSCSHTANTRLRTFARDSQQISAWRSFMNLASITLHNSLIILPFLPFTGI